jgi:TRAP-type C4-dicarboxylate transport system substrate-binding protein
MGFKDFLTRKLLDRQLKNLPPEQQEIMKQAIMENPEFFEKIAKEIKQKQSQGKGEMGAAMEVMRQNQSQLQKIMSKYQQKG